jgi:signal transduction histidine kinase
MLVDAVATDVTARRRLELRHRQLVAREAAYAAQVGTLRDHAALFRDANDNVLQRLFAARLRLDMLQRKLEAAEAHAVSTIAFQLDQASTDLREVIKGLDAVLVEVLPDTA